MTPTKGFADMVPWLILAATALFVWGSFCPKPKGSRYGPAFAPLSGSGCSSAQSTAISVAVSVSVLVTVLTAAGLTICTAKAATKNVLAAIINVAALGLFLFSPEVVWLKAVVLGAGAMLGGAIGNMVLNRINERLLRIAIVVIGVVLSAMLFLR
ncbi:MAG: TSUP family transporter [Sphingomonadales bacterium]|nr:TSUP family transporter [Sphingomonadales bacterium]